MLVLAESSKLDVVHCSQKRSGAAFFGQMLHRECECDEEGDAVRDNQRYESANRRAQPSCGRQRLAPLWRRATTSGNGDAYYANMQRCLLAPCGRRRMLNESGARVLKAAGRKP